MIRTVAFINTTTYRTKPGRITRVYRHDQNPGAFRFVDNLLTQVIEAPRVMLSPVSLSNRYPVPDTLQIFQGNTSTGVFGLFNNPLADDVVNVICHSAFFAAALFEQPFSRFSTLALQFLSQLGVTAAKVIQMVAGVGVAIRISGNILNTQVNADKFININWLRCFNFARAKQVKSTVNISQVRLAALILQQFKLSLAGGKRNTLTALGGPDRNLLLINVPAQDSGVIGDSAVLLKKALGFLIQLVGVSNLRDAADYHLSSKAKVAFHIIITHFMKPKLVKYTIAPRPLAYTITGRVSRFQCFEQRLVLLLIRLQLHFSRKFHRIIVAQVFYCVKCLIGGIRRIPPLFENRGLLRQIL